MRQILVLGDCHGMLLARLAAELATKNVQLILAEGPDTAHAIARALDAAEAENADNAHDADEDGVIRAPSDDVLVLGAGSSIARARARALAASMAFELQNYHVAEPAVEPYILAKSEPRYWEQSNQRFDRKQQGMRAKAHRR